jgi:arginyl-tRNA synthetase
LKKDDAKDIQTDKAQFELLTADAEWELIKTLDAWNETLQTAAEKMNPSGIATWLYELAKNFSRFYHECPILNAEDQSRAAARLALCRAVRSALQNAMELVCIPFLTAM